MNGHTWGGLRRILMGAGFACTIVAARPVSAADRTVCFDLRIQMASDIIDCGDANDSAVRRICEPGAQVAAIGQRVELWDKDPSGNPDDYIGTWIIASSGVQCATFPYEGMPYAAGDANPDVYIRLPVEVQRTNASGPVLRAIQDNGSDYPGWTWRGSDSDDTFVYNNCATGGQCRIYPSGHMVPTTSTTSWESLSLMAMDFGQRTLEVYGSSLGTAEIRAEIPRSECSGGCSFTANDIGIGTTAKAKQGDTIAHELGHTLHKREFDNMSVLPGDCGGGWSWNSTENESCAIEEGFASYVAAVSWWNPGNSTADPEYSGNDVEDPDPLASTCSTNIQRPGQYAKAFWDLDDFNDEPADSPATVADSQNIGTTTLSSMWGLFTSGTGNGGYNEANPTGRNIWDYRNRDSFAIGTAFISHNCLQSADQSGY